jgi:UDP-N-acetyl-D-glucosamine/UDP-N-acetyl-D-galactosamine dehydrogenase
LSSAELLAGKFSKRYNAVIVAVSHEEYRTLDEGFFSSVTLPNAVLVDVKGIYRNRIKNMVYWSL